MPDASTYQRRTLDEELDELSASLAAISLEGAKAVGKTKTASKRSRTIYRLDRESPRATVAADIDSALSADPPILLDEWQFVPETWDAIRRAVDDGAAPGAFLLTGSAFPRRGGKHSGAGRIVTLRMRPLSLAERLAPTSTIGLSALLTEERPEITGTCDLTLVDYTDEILASGFPGLRGLPERILRKQLDGYLSHVVDHDFPELGQRVRNPAGLTRWMAAYAAATASTASFEKIRAAATTGEGDKPARSTVRPYLDALQRLFMIDPLPAWLPTRNRLSRVSQAPKHHLVDPALAARLLGVTKSALLMGEEPELATPRDGPFLGALFESLVTQSMHTYAQSAEARVGHLRLHRGDREIDLIIERGDGRVVAVEVKLGEVPDERDVRHLHWLAEVLGGNLLDAVVVTTGKYAYRRKDGIAVIPAGMLGP